MKTCTPNVFSGVFGGICISMTALNHKRISNDASHLKYIDNFICVSVTWICALGDKKSGMTKSRHCY